MYKELTSEQKIQRNVLVRLERIGLIRLVNTAVEALSSNKRVGLNLNLARLWGQYEGIQDAITYLQTGNSPRTNSPEYAVRQALDSLVERANDEKYDPNIIRSCGIEYAILAPLYRDASQNDEFPPFEELVRLDEFVRE